MAIRLTETRKYVDYPCVAVYYIHLDSREYSFYFSVFFFFFLSSIIYNNQCFRNKFSCCFNPSRKFPIDSISGFTLSWTLTSLRAVSVLNQHVCGANRVFYNVGVRVQQLQTTIILFTKNS